MQGQQREHRALQQLQFGARMLFNNNEKETDRDGEKKTACSVQLYTNRHSRMQLLFNHYISFCVEHKRVGPLAAVRGLSE